MNIAFAEWLNQQIQEHGWTQAEFARRAGTSPSHVSRVVAGTHDAGLDFYRGTARALRMTLEDILHLAGILPPPTAPPAVRERRIMYEVNGEETLLGLWRALSVEDQALVRDLLVRLAQATPKIVE